MILIDFEVDEEELKEDLEEELDQFEDCLFVLTIFIMPVRILIGEVDLFEYNNKPWAWMPIMGVACGGLRRLRELKRKGKEEFDLPQGAGILEFTMLDQKNVHIFYKGFAQNYLTMVDYDELVDAFKKFADKIRAFLWERVPQMNNHPYWGPWLRGEKDW